MKKYQEALNYLDWHCNVEHKEQQDLLQELVDKETPLKPIKKPKGNHDQFSDLCPKCKYTLLYKATGCHNNKCRQKIDWGDEE